MRTTRHTSIAAATITCALFTLPLGCSKAPSTATPSVQTASLSAPVAMHISVKGMHCDGCEGAICEKVTKIQGVTACKASHVAESVDVTAPQEQRAAIEAAITRLGYKLG